MIQIDAPQPTREAVDTAINHFAEQLSALRRNAPHGAPTIRELADNGNIPRSTTYAVLAGKRLPTTDNLRALVTAWGGDLGWWLDWRALIAKAQRHIPPTVQRTNHAKLVRDKIPPIIRSTGAEPNIRVADHNEYEQLLRDKLREEVKEFLDSDDPHALADILEVLHALAHNLGLSPDQLEKLRADKAAERGVFTNRIVWSGNHQDPGLFSGDGNDTAAQST